MLKGKNWDFPLLTGRKAFLGTGSVVLVNFTSGKMKFVQYKIDSFWNPECEMKRELLSGQADFILMPTFE